MTIGDRPSSTAAGRRHPYRGGSWSLLNRLLAAPRAWHERVRQRRHLRQLDDRLLRDVGLTHGDVRRESGRPPSRT